MSPKGSGKLKRLPKAPPGGFRVVGVMGGGDVGQSTLDQAFELGKLIALKGWILLTGGRDVGVMDAASRGASEIKGSLSVGILPGTDRTGMSEGVDLPIFSGMGDARNVINVLSSDVLVICRGGAGTISELALALKNRKPVVLLDFREADSAAQHMDPGGLVYHAQDPEEAVLIITGILPARGG